MADQEICKSISSFSTRELIDELAKRRYVTCNVDQEEGLVCILVEPNAFSQASILR